MLGVVLPIEPGMQNHAGVPHPMEVALVPTATVITEKSDVDTIAAFGLLHCVQGLMDIADEVHDELQGFGTLVAGRILVGQDFHKVVDLQDDCGIRAMANIIPRRWRTGFRGHGERHSDMMSNMIPK
jgi:hypothetical protein